MSRVRIDPETQQVFKLFPANPPRKGEPILVDGVRHRVTRARVKWDGPRWTLLDLRAVRDCEVRQ